MHSIPGLPSRCDRSWFRRVLRIGTILVTLSGAQLHAADEPPTGDAWNALLDRVNRKADRQGVTYSEVLSRWPRTSPDFWLWLNRYREEIRSDGLELWAREANSAKRALWLARTLEAAPFYWIDWAEGSRVAAQTGLQAVATDDEQRIAWENRYLRLRAEVMADPDVPNPNKRFIRGIELANSVSYSQLGSPQLRGALHDYAAARAIWDWYADAGDLESLVPVLYLVNRVPADETFQEAFLASLLVHPNERLRQLGAGRMRILDLKRNGFSASWPSLSGDEMVSVPPVGGKVVLLDIWANSCAACLEAIPELERLHRTYASRGFQVIGLWLAFRTDPREIASEKERAIGYLRNHDVSYSNGMIVGESARSFMREYGLTGVPVMWLLDGDGKLIAITSIETLENKLRELLGLTELGE
jgi:thiol-disulfide isomerase/thioredoxin